MRDSITNHDFTASARTQQAAGPPLFDIQPAFARQQGGSVSPALRPLVVA